MHNITTREIKHYIKNIQKLMPVYSKVEKQYLSFMQERIFDYITENPFCTMENINKQFGEPKDVMEQYLLALDNEDIQNKLRVKRKVTLISITCITIVLIVSLFFAMKYYQGHLLAQKGYVEQEEIIIDEF